ncbi:hypothetical protein M427DRAFT_68297 [Gonapodya prolifera JEL478]|uniref:F-box domain-containing protein n=1 Tax=Gonapodya prolifera (strain JEL478) TaxID=1344416 RepID=A0A139AM32_GONPJ|nr:hypothetical protein M427DRAFT_68297 [Gonapodya prolifera JEL478]|eukprot:KXS17819.1 hypothetical protein M427DRAFT_68297 [Gonapodya prolifera JEL478]
MLSSTSLLHLPVETMRGVCQFLSTTDLLRVARCNVAIRREAASERLFIRLSFMDNETQSDIGFVEAMYSIACLLADEGEELPIVMARLFSRARSVSITGSVRITIRTLLSVITWPNLCECWIPTQALSSCWTLLVALLLELPYLANSKIR